MTATIQVGATQRSSKDLIRTAVSGWLGTAMEYMDFQLYSLAAAIIFPKIFFPNFDPVVGLLIAFMTYGVGFLARPVGAWFFGRMGDRVGRKKVLVITIMMMGVSTMLIGFLPGYAQIGLAAPVILVFLRLAQGFGAGAELSGASVMLAEYAPPKKRGLIASFVCLGTNSGTLLASGLWVLLTLLPEEALMSWGWRLPFIASIGITLYALWMRRNLKESPVFEAARAQEIADAAAAAAFAAESGAAVGQSAEAPTALAAKTKRKGKAFFLAMALRIGESGNSAMIQTFLIGYIVTGLSMDKSVGTFALLIGSFLGFATVPLAGWLSDKFGRRSMYRALSGFQMCFAVPALLMMQSRDPFLVSLALIIGLSVSVLGMFSVQSAYVNELFGSRNRYTQLAMAKEIGGVLSGGLAPIIAAGLLALFTNSWWPVAGMMVLYSAIAFVATFFAPETKGRDLTLVEDAV
ncbi:MULTISPECIES: MFS transporter [unclassified Pseudarthrobacter]|uniref:MFS transporter n=1 Tax=unclassified Pseudarthrobacter TaxID=2647000 RepID=UPI0011329E86|nr:MFS transporter [Pseudarthrobacter sp. NIBRBAC000502772]QDG68012.1 MHS family MFS transporter [Pseudarthrobacter sp. NIBRBAC000502772]